MSFELDKWPVIPAKHYTNANRTSVRVLVIHDMEAPEKDTTAEAVARMFASTDRKASAHLCIDNNSIVRCVSDADVAWAAPGANSDGIQFELAGYARQNRTDWLDVYSRAVIENTAKAVAQYCVKYGIPAVKLTVAELKAGKKGIVGHADVSKAYGKSSHTDPGSGFPWDYLVKRVNYWLPYYKNNRSWPKGTGPAQATKPQKAKAAVTRGYTVENVKAAQRAVHVTPDGDWGAGTDRALYVLLRGVVHRDAEIRALQTVIGVKVDGDWGPVSQKAYVEAKKALQRALKVKDDGVIGDATKKAFSKMRKQFYGKF